MSRLVHGGRRHLVPLWLFVLALADVFTVDDAAAADLIIDQSASYLSLSGYVNNFAWPNQTLNEPITAQSPGSLTSSLSGILSVNVNQGAANTISVRTIQIAPQNTPGLFSPGNTPANFAGRIENPEYGGMSTGYIDDLLLSITGTNLPLRDDGTFPANFISNVQFIGGNLVWVTPAVNFTGTQSAITPLRTITTDLATLQMSADGSERLTIPIDAVVTMPSVGQLTHFEIQGQVVAQGQIPEPAAACLAAIGAACTLAGLLRRRIVRGRQS